MCAPFFGQIFPRQIFDIIQDVLVLPLLHLNGDGHQNTLENNHFSRGEPSGREDPNTLHPDV